MQKKFLFFILSVFLFGGTALATPVQWDSGTGANFHSYEIYLFDTAISWTDANTAAEALTYNGRNGYLASITSLEENTFVSSLLSSSDWLYNGTNGFMGPWIGGSDADTEGTWAWTTGESFSYTAWASNQDGTTSTQDYLHYYTNISESSDPVGDMTWNDYADWGAQDSGKVFGYIVEFNTTNGGSAVPEPSTLALFGIGLIGAIGIGRKKMK